ncbi:MAG: glycine--tRNA ligase subunit beta [bacterium]|nr:glycine--tRNA ligase subunit beta [bacterium]
MHKNFLFEIGTEELPLSAQMTVRREAKNIFSRLLTEQKLFFKNIELFITPTRIVIKVNDLALEQTTPKEIIAGPPKRIAYNEEGKPSAALLGFMKKLNLSSEEVKEKITDKGIYLYAEKESLALQTSKLLPEICLEFSRKLPFSKMMVWNNSGFKFIRPIRWILAIFDDELIDLEIAEVKNEKASYGIGGFRAVKFDIVNIVDYFKKLEETGLILDFVKRKNIITQSLKACGMLADNDSDLLDEVTSLVEYPTAVLCDFTEEFLRLPEPVIYTVLKNHQKCFSLANARGVYSNKFIAICNGKDRNLELVKEGYQKVAVARLNDAVFFYDEDSKIPLRNRVRELKTLIYQEKLGTVFDKLQRMKEITKTISQSHQLERIIDLCKTDLLTHMVYEFPELQGVMGKFYALNNEEELTAQAIEDHYLPKFVGDNLPQTNEGAIVSIADKLDNIVSTFILGKKPTGSKDPFGLRRQIYGIFNIFKNKKLNKDILDLIKVSLDTFKPKFDQKHRDKTLIALQDFLNARIENWLLEEGIRVDIVRSVIFNREKCLPLDFFNKSKLMMNVIDEKQFLNVVELYKRANNILKKTELSIAWQVREDLFESEAEKDLYTHASFLSTICENYYSDMLSLFYSQSLSVALYNFFETVRVMDENQDKRNNRLYILKILVDSFKAFADFSELSIEG